MEGNVAVWASRAERLVRRTMAAVRCEGNRRKPFFPRDLCRERYGSGCANQECGVANQLLSSGLIFLANSSNEASPLIFSPLMKKVGVESTFNTSLAYFWSAAILSSSA